MVLLVCLFIFVGVPILAMYLLDPNAVIEAFKRSPKYNVQDEMSLFNDAEWVKKVILSCKTTAQVWNTYELSKILRKKYDKKVEGKVMRLVTKEISNLFDVQENKLFMNEVGRSSLSRNKK